MERWSWFKRAGLEQVRIRAPGRGSASCWVCGALFAARGHRQVERGFEHQHTITAGTGSYYPRAQEGTPGPGHGYTRVGQRTDRAPTMGPLKCMARGDATRAVEHRGHARGGRWGWEVPLLGIHGERHERATTGCAAAARPGADASTDARRPQARVHQPAHRAVACCGGEVHACSGHTAWAIC